MKVESRTVRALTLGQAIAVRPPKIADGPPSEGKTHGQMLEEHAEWRDSQPLVTLCSFCDWTFKGSALDGRTAALQHRLEKHPEATIRRPRRNSRISPRKTRTPEENAQASIDAAEANRVRAEREDAERLAKIERGRQRDALAERSSKDFSEGKVLEETAAVGQTADSGSAALVGEPERAAVTSSRVERWPPDAIIAAIQRWAAEHDGKPPIGCDWKPAPAGYPTKNTVLKKFGTWAAAIEAAGFPRPTAGRTRSGLERAGVGATPMPTAATDGKQSTSPDTDQGREPQAREGKTRMRRVSAQANEPSRPDHGEERAASRAPASRNVTAARSTDLEIRENALRDPIRTADIPYDADLLENEAAFLRRRAAALEQIAGGIRELAVLSEERAA